MGVFRSLFKRKPPSASDNDIAAMIAYQRMTRIDGKPYFTYADHVCAVKGDTMISLSTGDEVTLTPTAIMFLFAHLNTVPVVSVH